MKTFSDGKALQYSESFNYGPKNLSNLRKRFKELLETQTNQVMTFHYVTHNSSSLQEIWGFIMWNWVSLINPHVNLPRIRNYNQKSFSTRLHLTCPWKKTCSRIWTRNKWINPQSCFFDGKHAFRAAKDVPCLELVKLELRGSSVGKICRGHVIHQKKRSLKVKNPI